MAQKLHAVSNPREPNNRFRDLVDLQLLDALHDRARDRELREAREAVFAVRAEHDWPPTLSAGEGWDAGYRALADELESPDDDVQAAIHVVQATIDRITAPSACEPQRVRTIPDR